MEMLLIALVICVLLLVDRIIVLSYKCNYYKQKLDNNNINSSVEMVTNSLDVFIMKD